MKHILIVEDNEKLKIELAQFFRNNGYEVSSMEGFEHVLEDNQRIAPDLVLLDLNLPGVDGLFICRELRMQSVIPIVIMTSRNTELDELIGMNYGADDFITKPFNTQILLARVNNIFKRMDRTVTSKVQVSGLTLDISRSCISSGGMEVELTKNELKILHQLSLYANWHIFSTASFCRICSQCGRFKRSNEDYKYLWGNGFNS